MTQIDELARPGPDATPLTGSVPWARPRHPRHSVHPLRAFGREFGLGLMFLGVVVLLFAGYELWGTGLSEARSQHRLRQEFAAAPPQAGTGLPGGRVIGEIVIPRIGVDQFVVQGVGEDDLRLGPGHYPSTPLPGQSGNAAIAGHRTTYGAPFFNLNDLKPGDRIVTRTAEGRFVYLVRQLDVVRPSDVAVIAPTHDNRLTLTTCNPRFSARQRLVVVATLQGKAAPAPGMADEAGVHAAVRGPDLGGNSAAWPAAMIWGLFLSALWAGGRWTFRRGRKAFALLAGIPLSLLVVWPLFASVVRLLPADI